MSPALEQRRVPGQLLCYEISDTDVIAALADESRFVGDAKRLGCKLSLDGFGSAGVGFDHVKRLPLGFLKIDGRIVLAITRDPVAAAKVKAIQHVCRLTGVRAIAEMVESDEVRQKLHSLETDYAQSFGIARPHPLEALARCAPGGKKANRGRGKFHCPGCPAGRRDGAYSGMSM